ncbi:MAG: thioredoxin domain-containing protein, partial [Nitrospinaceae bacterium]|nr:thioredoxin domain-containing protein [Nitrospinaceae bacterium]NIR53413.1 thioredoxin domain-containing protein [Nitrospinaceae bacterium]NIS85676.1 thioredoxin domain-containing protein [Nitrospinaceae bacterium]NIT82521.1 thioredoxin domain-containing protein [Nitrospinaceae bacterium]NIU44669.1 thioredoxin domain-containing protein [Nitrospinaceae bacterium]
RFWEFQDILYRDYNDATSLDSGELVRSAREAGVPNLKKFDRCWKSRRHKDLVMQDIREGTQLGIQGTPTFILGLYDRESGTVSGELLSGAVSEEKFSQVI